MQSVSLVHSTQTLEATAHMARPLPAQSLLELQAGAHRWAPHAQTSPGGHCDANSHSTQRRSSRSQYGAALAQSLLVTQPVQVCETVLQTIVAQSSLARHCTHRLARVSQNGVGAAQSPLPVHSGFGMVGPASGAPASRRSSGVPPSRDIVFASLQ